MKYLMVLNDGETFTEVAGCRIIRVNEDNIYTAEALDDGEVPEVFNTVIEFIAPDDGQDGFDTINYGMIPENEP